MSFLALSLSPISLVFTFCSTAQPSGALNLAIHCLLMFGMGAPRVAAAKGTQLYRAPRHRGDAVQMQTRLCGMLCVSVIYPFLPPRKAQQKQPEGGQNVLVGVFLFFFFNYYSFHYLNEGSKTQIFCWSNLCMMLSGFEKQLRVCSSPGVPSCCLDKSFFLSFM